MLSSSQDSIKWLPKSPKLYGGHNWNSQGSRWSSLKGKESFHGGNLYKFSSANGKWREGRISPEQEAEELEDPDDVGSLPEFRRDNVVCRSRNYNFLAELCCQALWVSRRLHGLHFHILSDAEGTESCSGFHSLTLLAIKQSIQSPRAQCDLLIKMSNLGNDMFFYLTPTYIPCYHLFQVSRLIAVFEVVFPKDWMVEK